MIVINGWNIDWRLSKKDLNLLTFLESLVLFVCPSTGHFTLRLGCCLVFLVASYFKDRGLFLLADYRCMSRRLNGATSTLFVCPSHMTKAAFERTLLRYKLLRERGFISRVSQNIFFMDGEELLTGAFVRVVGRQALVVIVAFLTFWLWFAVKTSRWGYCVSVAGKFDSPMYMVRSMLCWNFRLFMIWLRRSLEALFICVLEIDTCVRKNSCLKSTYYDNLCRHSVKLLKKS